jgi:hypothetical protein
MFPKRAIAPRRCVEWRSATGVCERHVDGAGLLLATVIEALGTPEAGRVATRQNASPRMRSIHPRRSVTCAAVTATTRFVRFR